MNAKRTIALILSILLLPLAAYGQGSPRKKLFGKGSPFSLEELPAGELKAKLGKLNPQARAKAMQWLHKFQFPESDAAKHLRVDPDGGIYIVCPGIGCDCGHEHDTEQHASDQSYPTAVENAPEAPQDSVPPLGYATAPISSPPTFNSRPNAPYHIYLDFNGGIVTGTAWNSSNGIASYSVKAWSQDADLANFSDSEQTSIRRMWERISEDFAPFNVNVTTDTTYDPVNYTGNKNNVGWLMIAPTVDNNNNNLPHAGSGGIAYVGVYGEFNYHTSYQPAWVTANTSSNIANICEAASHEMGHNMGLSHDGTSTLEYYGGHTSTSSAPSWGPIMGTGYNRDVSQWSKGEYYTSNQTQDDLTIIANRIGYRANDYGGTYGTASILPLPPVSLNGVIENTNEADYFTFTTQGGTATFNANAFKSDSGTWGSNLDIHLAIYNSSLALVAENNPLTDVNATLSTNLPAGTYYLVVRPAATGTPTVASPSGYSIYGSLGQYTITGTYNPNVNTLIVLEPNGGEVFDFNSTTEIQWLSNTPGNVKIELLKGGNLQSVIAANETNDGSYNWLVSPALPAGNDYSIKISSIADAAFSDTSNANFSLQALPTLATAVDSNGLTWTNSGNLPWFPQTTTTKDGFDAAQSGAINHNQNSSMETTVAGPGTLTFWWKISSETSYDYLRFYVDGVEQTGILARISGTVDWVQKTVSIPSGNHVVKWSYTKDGSVVSGSDAAWVDQVTYTAASAPEVAVEYPANTNLTDNTATINCGTATVSNSITPVTFTVKNLGIANLTGLALTKDGSHNADFSVSSLGATTLAPGASTTFTVTFTPGATGTRNAAIHLSSNDADENPFDIALTGTGVTVGTLAVTPSENLSATGSTGGPFSPSSLQYTLSNPGNSSINWTASSSANWITLSATSGTLAAGANTTVTVSINSNANTLGINSYSDTVSFTNTTNGNGNTTRAVSLTVNPLPATVTINSLSQTYNGSPKPVTVTTTPSGLSHTITYNGSATAPSNAGTYSVVATITQPGYVGSDTKDLVIGKASQSITFNPLGTVGDTTSDFPLTATSSSGLPVSLASSDDAVASLSGNILSINAIGTATITASQAGNSNYQTAPAVSQVITVVRDNPSAITTGPYKVLIDQFLSLNGQSSQPSHGATITSYEWDLNGDDNFTDATGPQPSQISVATLTSTWQMNQGVNSIRLRVTDSASKTSIVTTTVELILALTWDANSTSSGLTDAGGAWLDVVNNRWWDGSDNIPWTSGSSASFGNGGGSGTMNVTLASPTDVNSFAFHNFSGTYQIGSTGQAITLAGGITKNSGSGSVIFVSPITLGSAQTWTNNSTATLATSHSANLVNNGGYNLTIDGIGSTLFGVINTTSLALTGSGALIKNGSGVLSLGGANTDFTSSVTVNGGVVRVNSPLSVNGNINLTNGVFEHYWNSPLTRTLGTGYGQIQITGGASGFSQNGNTSMTVTLNNNAAFELVWGTSLFNPSSFILQADTAQQSSSLTLANKIDLNGSTRTIHVSGGTTGAARASITGQIRNSTGTAGLIKTGAGILTLSNNATTWNGATAVNSGILDFNSISMNSNIGGGTGRNISVAAGAGVRFNALTNALLNRIVETSAEISVMTNTTTANFDFSSSTGANLPNAFLGNWASNGAKMELGTAAAGTGVITPAADNYRLGAKGSSGLLAIIGTNKLTGTQGLLVGGTGASGIRVMLAGPNNFSGDTVINSGAKLTIAHNLALQNSPLNVGSAGGNFALNSAGTVTNAAVANSPTLGGLIGSRHLVSVFTNAVGNNETNLAATAVEGFTLNLAADKSLTYSGNIVDFAVGTTLTKAGPGTQTLSGSHSFTGKTSINAGKLLFNGSLSNVDAALNVANAASLGGTGSIGRNVTIEDGGMLEFSISSNADNHDRLDISPGRSFHFAGASALNITSSGGASPGIYTLISGGNAISGVAPSTLTLPTNWIATVSISGNSLLLNLISTTGSGPVDHFVISPISTTQTIGVPITGITITAEDALNITAINFNGTVNFGGSGGFSGTSGTFVNGVLTNVSVTPTIAGTNRTLTVDDGSGHTGSTTIASIQTAFQSWTTTSGLAGSDALTTANPDGDALNNLQEFAFGTNPSQGGMGPIAYQPNGALINPGAPLAVNFSTSPVADFRAVFTRRKNFLSARVTYTVQFSADLSTWTNSAVEPTILTGPANPAEVEAVSVPFPELVPAIGGNKKPTYFRVSVSLP